MIRDVLVPYTFELPDGSSIGHAPVGFLVDCGIPEEVVLHRLRLEECRSKRAAEYPPIAEYIDGVVKGDQAQIDAYIAACLAVKAKYPKPE